MRAGRYAQNISAYLYLYHYLYAVLPVTAPYLLPRRARQHCPRHAEQKPAAPSPLPVTDGRAEPDQDCYPAHPPVVRRRNDPQSAFPCQSANLRPCAGLPVLAHPAPANFLPACRHDLANPGHKAHRALLNKLPIPPTVTRGRTTYVRDSPAPDWHNVPKTPGKARLYYQRLRRCCPVACRELSPGPSARWHESLSAKTGATPAPENPAGCESLHEPW